MSLDSCRTVIPRVGVPLIIQNDAISEPAPEVTKSVLAKSEQAQSIMEDESVPITLADTLSDFFRIAGDLELGAARLAQPELNGFCPYGLDLLDRLGFLLPKIKIIAKRDAVARTFASMAAWVPRRGAIIANPQGTADNFGMIVNGTSGTHDLPALCEVMEEVIEAASLRLRLD